MARCEGEREGGDPQGHRGGIVPPTGRYLILTNGVLVFKGMKLGFLPADFSIKLTGEGGLSSRAVLSTSYNVIALWLRAAYDNNEQALKANSSLIEKWNDSAERQKQLLLAELAPAMQVFVSCGVAFDCVYELLRPHANITASDIQAWKKNKTSRSSQISEVVRRVFRLSNDTIKDIKGSINSIMTLRDEAVHPTH